MKKKSHNQQPPKQPLSEKLIAFFAGFFVCLVGCLMFSHFKQDPVPPFRPDEPEWLSWPPLDLKPNEEESQLILPFLQGRQALQNALEEWFRDNSQDVYSYVDLMVENSFPPLSVNIEELFKCKKSLNANSGECLNFPYHLYQIGCDSTGCFYFFARQHGTKRDSDADGEYFINATMDTNFRWDISCYSFINPKGAAEFCDYLRREWNLR